MAGVSTEAKVGVFVMVAIALLGYMTLRLGDFQIGEPAGYEVWALFDSASGLKLNAPVEMAGITIGKVAGVSLDQGRARITLRINEDVHLPADVQALIRTRGVLGDKFVSIEGGSPAAPPLENGQRLARASVPTDLDQVMSRIGQVAEDIGAITSSLKMSIASPESQRNIAQSLSNIKELTDTLKVVIGDNQARLDNIIANLDNFSENISQLSDENRSALTSTIQNFAKASANMEQTMHSLNSVLAKIDDGKGTIGQLVNNDQTVRDLNSTLASLRQVSDKINQGKGTLGRLVNDDATIDKIDQALTGINDYIGQGDAWRLKVDYRGEYLFQHEALRSEVNVLLQPRMDKFYLLGVVSDPVGRRRETLTDTTTNTDGEISHVRVKQFTTDKDDLTFNAQIGKRFYDAVIRAGLFQSTGGFALDYMLMDDDLRLTMELFDFSTDEKPHLKLRSDYRFMKYFYVTAGVDDVLSDQGNSTFFMGGGFYFDDNDLKFLLTKAPTP
ncbi:Mammalian cell entry related domain protein [Desulfarculus baarsii DSM 2075]|uniref:Mammalian cell entry related domain protein n=1 Tax=Desulfarculus baarsii (strain ATCC 33931 / DSM 2075 / LMG 7858 / VKM B-1802 / 2st14) TaxID=644282 RepID=E1QG67_DESB2|nr:MlaD family protein [Desulfarculus baarsii]ADK83579.1 Mammalian cell entry related domain protein [Desulfarculus baarsii DSM 2075]